MLSELRSGKFKYGEIQWKICISKSEYLKKDTCIEALMSTLQYRIEVQDRISMQGEEIAILNKHAGSNKIVQAVFFVKKGLK